MLVSHFVNIMRKKTGKTILDTSRQVMQTLMNYSWPGNVRELENAIEHAFVLCGSDRIELEDLPVEILLQNNATAVRSHARLGRQARRQALTKEQLLQQLTDCDWNKAEVARRLGSATHPFGNI